jgi:hypothetical protein
MRGFLASVSLLICLAFAAAWLISHDRGGARVWRRTGGTEQWVMSTAGRVVIDVEQDRSGRNRVDRPWKYERMDYPFDPPHEKRWFNRLGFGYTHRQIVELTLDGPSKQHPLTQTRLWFPYWAPTGLFAVAPLLYLRSAVRHHVYRRRASRGHCAHCGYDLRSSPDRCPECGRSSGRSATAAGRWTNSAPSATITPSSNQGIACPPRSSNRSPCASETPTTSP